MSASAPPDREWGVRHPRGKVTVQLNGYAFPIRILADEERYACDQDCAWCDGGPRVLVYRDKQPWQETP